MPYFPPSLPTGPPFAFTNDGAGTVLLEESQGVGNSRTRIANFNDSPIDSFQTGVDCYSANLAGTDNAEAFMGADYQPGIGATGAFYVFHQDGSGIRYKTTTASAQSQLELWPNPTETNTRLFTTYDNGGNPSFGSLGSGDMFSAKTAAAVVAVGAIARKLEIFDSNGTSLGFIPIYATIT